MEVICAGEVSSNHIRNEISSIFVDGFYEWIKFFSKDKDVLKKAFAYMFNLDAFYIAIIDEAVAGFASISNDRVKNISLNRKQLQKHLGFFMGFFAYKVLRKEFEDKKYPFTITSDMQPIEFVATSSNHQRCGVASKIIQYIFEHDPHTLFVLEVADTNSKAVALYKKLGFKEITRIKMKNSKQSGVDNLLYMEYVKTNQDSGGVLQ